MTWSVQHLFYFSCWHCIWQLCYLAQCLQLLEPNLITKSTAVDTLIPVISDHSVHMSKRENTFEKLRTKLIHKFQITSLKSLVDEFKFNSKVPGVSNLCRPSTRKLSKSKFSLSQQQPSCVDFACSPLAYMSFCLSTPTS